MANKLTLSAVGLLSLLAAGTFAQTATTDPVGFVKVTVPGAPAGGESYAYPALTLVRAQEYRGVVTANTATVITDSAAAWTDNQFNGSGATPTHYVEILSGDNAGATFDISATNAASKSIVVAANFGAGSLAGQNYRIRKHWTLGAVFGVNNTAGFAAGSTTTADLISVWGGTKYVTYYYRNVSTQIGWRSIDSATVPAADAVIYPEDGVFIKRRGQAALELVFVGDVRTGATKYAITRGFNLLDCSNPVGFTLGNSNLFTGDVTTGLKPGTTATADLVQIWNGNGFAAYYVRKLPSSPTILGWRSIDDAGNDASGVVLPAGGAVIIRRQPNAPDFVWSRPQPF